MTAPPIDKTAIVEPPGDYPPQLPCVPTGMAGSEGFEKSLADCTESSITTQHMLEEYFASLKERLNLTCDYTFLTIRRLEDEKVKLLTENAMLKNASRAVSKTSGHLEAPQDTGTHGMAATGQSSQPKESLSGPIALPGEVTDPAPPRTTHMLSERSQSHNGSVTEMTDSQHLSKITDSQPLCKPRKAHHGYLKEPRAAGGRASMRLSVRPQTKLDNSNGKNQKLQRSFSAKRLGGKSLGTAGSAANTYAISDTASGCDDADDLPTRDRSILDISKRFTSHTEDPRNDAHSQWDLFGVFHNIGVQKTERIQKHAVFADAEIMKEKVRAAMKGPEYSVHSMYTDKGVAQKIARSWIFENFTLFVITFNALWIGIECDANRENLTSKVPIGFVIVENFFCAYFFLEIIVRFLAFKHKAHSVQDAWFMFDAMMAFLYVLETWILVVIVSLSKMDASDQSTNDMSILRVVRLLRLTRMARMARLLRALPEVMILIKGVSLAMRSVFFTLLLLIMIMYIFAVAFVQLTKDTTVGKSFFNSVLDAMKTLLLNGTFLENIPDCYYACASESEFLGILLLIYVLIASLTVMNMLIGVLVDVVAVVANVEKETLVTAYVKQYLEKLWSESGMDVNKDGKISQDEFELLLEHEDAIRCLNSVGVDVVGLVDFADFIFRGEEHDFVDFVELVLMLRGTNHARVKDIVDLRKYLAVELEHKLHLQDCLIMDVTNQIEAMISALSKALEASAKTNRSATAFEFGHGELV